MSKKKDSIKRPLVSFALMISLMFVGMVLFVVSSSFAEYFGSPHGYLFSFAGGMIYLEIFKRSNNKWGNEGEKAKKNTDEIKG